LKNKESNNLKKIVRFTSIPFEMFIIIFGFYKLGMFIDKKFPNEMAMYTLGLTLIGVFVSMGYIIWRVKKLHL
jgi:hypothetical protein